MLKRIGILLLAIVMVVGLTACTTTPQTSASPSSAASASAAPASDGASTMPTAVTSSKDTLNYAIDADPGTLSSVTPVANNAYGQIVYNIYDSLFTFDGSNNIVWQLATSYDQKDDTHVVFHIRQGVKLSDGSDFKASDVLFSMNLYKADKAASQSVARVDWDNTKVTDDYTIEVAFKQADITALGQFAFMKFTSEKAYSASKDQMKTTPVGSGPYMLKEWTTGSTVTLVANPNYWGNKPLVNTVVYKVISDATQRTNALLAGDVDFATFIQPSDVDTIKEGGDFTVSVQATNAADSIFFNTRSTSPCSSVALRQAIAYSVDKAGIQGAAYNGLAKLSVAPLSSAFRDFNPDWAKTPYYDYNLDKAKELVAEANLPAGTTLKIINNGSTEHTLAAQIIQASLAKIGVTLEITNYDPAVYFKQLADPEATWDMALQNIGAPSYLTGDCLNAWMLHLGVTGYKPDAFVTAINGALASTDVKAAAPFVNTIHDLVVQDVPFFSYVDHPIVYAYNSNLQGYNIMYMNNVNAGTFYFK